MPTACLTHPKAPYRKGLDKRMGGRSLEGIRQLIPGSLSEDPATALPRRASSGGGTRSGFPSTCTPSCRDRKSTRLNSSHQIISYAVFCLKKKKKNKKEKTIYNV